MLAMRFLELRLREDQALLRCTYVLGSLARKRGIQLTAAQAKAAEAALTQLEEMPPSAAGAGGQGQAQDLAAMVGSLRRAFEAWIRQGYLSQEDWSALEAAAERFQVAVDWLLAQPRPADERMKDCSS